MANEFRTNATHSAEYFGDTRDYWWNPDYLQLIARRLSFDRVERALDVGCGVGHWGNLLGRILPATARVEGVDREVHWVEKATERAARHGLSDRFHFHQGLAEKLPFADDSFDLVTSQTVLIHAADPGIVLDEMIRVLRSGGLIVLEPNNAAKALIFDSNTFCDPVDKLIAQARFQLVCERGNAMLGEGNNSIGDVLPGLLAKRGLVDIQVYLNDKVSLVVPPYENPEQRALLEETTDLETRDFWIWSGDDTRRYFLAGGGREDEFDELWQGAMSDAARMREAVVAGTYARAGASVAGRRPALEK
jgi:SAM-dependent methyltransferase